MAGVRAQIIQIGNSRGIRLPKTLLEESGLGEKAEVLLQVEGDRIIIAPARKPREGWEEAFRQYAAEGGDEEDFHEPLLLTESEMKEWEW